MKLNLSLSAFVALCKRGLSFSFIKRLSLPSFSNPFSHFRLGKEEMNSFNFVSQVSDPKNRKYLFGLFVAASLICGVYFLGSSLVANDYRIPQRSELEVNTTGQSTDYDTCKLPERSEMEVMVNKQETQSDKCKKRCRPPGSEVWPEGMLSTTADLRMRHMWGPVNEDIDSKTPLSLLAIAVGIKQKDMVNKIVTKFLDGNFTIMLFHYDGNVDQWEDLGWHSRVIHVSAEHQTKWWFAKRFLHPDVVAEYEYIFLWDEDLGVENFHPGRYLSIIREEELEISQPALDPDKSEVHHQMTARMNNSKVHRSYIKLEGFGRCYANSTVPPCTGWVEVMAPVFSKAAWRCTWYLIQSDLIHAWGMDFQLGYCAKGDRMKHVGVVDSEYIVHFGVPTLGGPDESKDASQDQHLNELTDLDDAETAEEFDNTNMSMSRSQVRIRANIELRIFWHKWWHAVEDDKCWVDPYKEEKITETKKYNPCHPTLV